MKLMDMILVMDFNRFIVFGCISKPALDVELTTNIKDVFNIMNKMQAFSLAMNIIIEAGLVIELISNIKDGFNNYD